MTDRSDRPTVVELTAKRWKLLSLVGHLLGWPGLVTFIVARANDAFAVANLAAAAAVAGLCLVFYAKFMAWWRHG